MSKGNSFLILGVTAFLSYSQFSIADEPEFHRIYNISDWRDLISERAAEYKNYRIIILSGNYTDDEKARLIARKYKEISNDLAAQRTSSYKEVSETLGVGNSATKGHSQGGSVRSDQKCISATKPSMFTRPEWARGAYKSGNEDAGPGILSTGEMVPGVSIVSSDGTAVCAIALKQSGKGRKISYSEADFKIRDEQIKAMVDAEVVSMMREISNTPL